MRKFVRQIAIGTGLTVMLGLSAGCGGGDKRDEAYYYNIDKICGVVETYGESVQCYNDAGTLFQKAIADATGDFNNDAAYKIAKNRTLIQLGKKYNVILDIEPEENAEDEEYID